MVRPISGFEFKYVVDKTMTPTSLRKVQLYKTCDNCYEKKQLCNMSNGLQVCEPCSKDIEALTNRLPPTEERS